MRELLPSPQASSQDAASLAIEAERELIGLAMVGQQLPEELPVIPEAAWSQPGHASIWGAIAAAHRDGTRLLTPQRVVTLISGPDVDEVERGRYRQALEGYLLTAPIVSGSRLETAIGDMARAVRGMANKRQLKAVAGDLARLADDPSIEAPEALAQIEGDLAKLRVGETMQPTTLRDLVVGLADQLERPAEVMSTGLAALDEQLAGGLWTGKLYGLAARPKVGKTLTAVTLARNIARAGHRVLYVALEMGQSEVAQRVIAEYLGINAVRFLKRDDPNVIANLIGYACRSDAPELENLMFRDAPGLSFEQLRSIAQSAKAQHGIKLLVVDYWQLIGGAQKGQNETQHLSDVAQWLANFARRSNISVFTPAQINRNGETRGSDGLRLACDWYGHMHPAGPNDARDRWIEGIDSRYTLRIDLGSEAQGGLYVDTVGPVLRERELSA